MGLPPICPPATSTFPFGSSVEVCAVRAVPSAPVFTKVLAPRAAPKTETIRRHTSKSRVKCNDARGLSDVRDAGRVFIAGEWGGRQWGVYGIEKRKTKSVWLDLIERVTAPRVGKTPRCPER